MTSTMKPDSQRHRHRHRRHPPHRPVLILPPPPCPPTLPHHHTTQEVYVLRPRLEIAMQSGSSDSDASEAIAKCKATSDAMGPLDPKTPPPLRGITRCRFFRNMLPDIPIAVSQPAGHFFLEEDFELALLKESTCPFSRQSQAAVDDYGPL